MSEYRHTVLCVDNEKNILNSIKRLLYKEEYRLLTASNGTEGLEILKENDVHLVISDQRMSEMTGIEFLSIIKEQYPDIVRVILTGYTDVGLMAESVNKGHVYKFFLKPWEDQTLKLEIKRALDHYDLLHTNRVLHKKILEQNKELKAANDNLEELVRKRTETLEIQNQVLELSRIILENIPIPVIGVGEEGSVVFINRQAESLVFSGKHIEVGMEYANYFSDNVTERLRLTITTNLPQTFKRYHIGNNSYDIDFTPLSGMFRGKGVVVTVRPLNNKN